MSGGSEVHIFWGAPLGPLKMTVSQGSSLMSTANPWEKIQLLYNQYSLYLKDENQEPPNLKDCQAPKAIGPAELLSGHFSVTCMSRSVQVKDDFIHSTSETQNIQAQKTDPQGLSDMTNCNVQICGFKGRVQHLPEEENHQKLQCENKKMIDEQPQNQSNIYGENFQTDQFGAILDLNCSTLQINVRPEAVGTKRVSTEFSHEIQSQQVELCCSYTQADPGSEGAFRSAAELKVSTDTEFLSIMTSSQLAFLAQGKDKGQNSINKGTLNMQTEPTGSHGEEHIIEDNLVRASDDFGDKHESGQNQTCSLELFSPECPESKSRHIYINSEKGLEESIDSPEVFNNEDKLPPNEIHIELCSSGILCSQLNTCQQSAIKRSWASEDKSAHSKTLSEVCPVSKKPRVDVNAGESAITVPQRTVSEFKDTKKITSVRSCDSKCQKYNCLLMVLTPCHVKEINIKSGPSSGSKVPLATITVIDQSEMKKKVVLWRTAAFWALTLFPGDIILLTDVAVHEDQWVGETVLQSTFTSQLLNLGNYSSVKSEEYFNVVDSVVLQDLLSYVSSKYSYLQDLPQRQPQKVNTIEFAELEQLQPDKLVHAVLRVVDVTILTEAVYTYRGHKQRKVVVTVEQVQGQHYVLVLWGPAIAWYPQLQRKKDCIWEFKNLFVQRNCILENLELHTTLWSSCECLFDDDVRAITFKAKFQERTLSFVKTSDLATHLKDKFSGVVMIKAKISELAFSTAGAQKIALNAHSSLKRIFSSLPNIIYVGCAQCGLELEPDENRIYRQCFSCLPFSRKKTYYRPALMTVVDGRQTISVHVGSKLMEQILLNIPPDCLNKVIGSPWLLCSTRRLGSTWQSTFLRDHLWHGCGRPAPVLVGGQCGTLCVEDSEPF
uniref:shieldin complex subunit 2 isoform X2 n=1 Tax=Jaculus jaculus TaxID=51337 RepID=UPI001E1B4F3A|nr:shieldin complex subunit 2 isoform X2 [Jaculus jaculus]